jgi:hypothetical protein
MSPIPATLTEAELETELMRVILGDILRDL